MRSEWACRPSAAEFPHDNPLVDRGALWIGGALCRVETVDPPPALAPAATLRPAQTNMEAEKPPDDPITTFLRTVTEVALAHGAAETVAHIESLFQFGTPAPLELSAPARAAMLEGNILETTEAGVRTTTWFSRASAAWQSMLRGESGDLSACGEATLDAWTADFIARLVANPSKAPTIRRDLRRRGIAAFGMLS